MRRLAEEIGRETSPTNASDALQLLERLFPLAKRLQEVQPDFWPFCEAIDRAGRLFFYPHGEGDELPTKADETELQEYVKLGMALTVFRSAGFVSPVVADGSAGFCVELLLHRELVVSLFVLADGRPLSICSLIR